MALLRWGILGTGQISNDFVYALRSLNPEENDIVAVGSRDMQMAKNFSALHHIPRAYGSYEEVCLDAEVDVLYVAAIHPYHAKLVEIALRHDKHVLCEKPLTMNLAEAQRIIQIAKERRVLLMEGMWTRFTPAYQDVQKILESGELGEVRVATVSIGLAHFEEVPRIYDPKLGSSMMLDEGIYALHFADIAFRGEDPIEVKAAGHKGDTGGDHTVSITMLYKEKKTAQLLVTCGVDLPCEGTIIGTKGVLKVEKPFWCPEMIITPQGPKEYKIPQPPEGAKMSFENTMGMKFEIEHFRQCVLDKKAESPIMTYAISEKIMKWMDTILAQV